MVRTIVGSDHKRLVVGCVFAGPALVVLAGVGARLALDPVKIPVEIVAGLIGGSYFLDLMRKRRTSLTSELHPPRNAYTTRWMVASSGWSSCTGRDGIATQLLWPSPGR